MRERETLCKISRMVISIFLPIVVLLSVLQVYAFDKKFYVKEFKKYDITEVTQIQEPDLAKIAEKLIHYLSGKEDDLEIQIKIKGQRAPVFGEREKQHMIDVKKLFQKGYMLRNTGVIFLTIAVIILFKLSQNMYKDIFKSFFNASVVSLTVMTILFLLIQIDFYKYFTYFHEIFFDNDLWLLDPKEDVLIQMLPLEFFIDIAIKVIISFIVIMGGIGGLSFHKLKQIR
ncbi:TIGR01906 family membrane protein [Clostridiaceae bacterium 35-E11]